MLQVKWLLSAIAAVIDLEPQLIKRLFVTKEYAYDGKYTVRLNRQGMWHDVTVDDYVPCYNNGGPIFSHGDDESLWLLILEKAFAKTYGGYKLLEGGSPTEALRDLLGSPISVFTLSNAQVRAMAVSGALWKLLTNFHKQESLLVAVTETLGTWQQGKKGNLSFPGLTGPICPGEAFSILRLVESNGVRLVKVSNRKRAWTWAGNYSAQSPLWTPELRSICDYPETLEQESYFWLTFDDLCNLGVFESIQVCRLQNWEAAEYRGAFVKAVDFDIFDGDRHFYNTVSKHYYGIEVRQRSHIIFGLHQEDIRS